jgi:spore germination protein YaaH
MNRPIHLPRYADAWYLFLACHRLLMTARRFDSDERAVVIAVMATTKTAALGGSRRAAAQRRRLAACAQLCAVFHADEHAGADVV